MICRFASQEENEGMNGQSPVEAAAMLRSVANGLRAAQALFVAAQLRVADHLSERALDSAELATATGSDPAALGRVMRALCALGIFAETKHSGQFALNSVGQLLRTDVPGSYRAGVLFLAGPVRWQCWSQLLETVQTGASASRRLLGTELFDFYATHPETRKSTTTPCGPSQKAMQRCFSMRSNFAGTKLSSMSAAERVSC